MALTLLKTGTEISTERLFVTATSDNVDCDAVQLRVFYQGITAEIATLVHEPDAGTTDEFTFEINSIIREFLKSELFDINSSQTFDKLNGLATLRFNEIESDVVQPATYDTFVNVKDFSFDNFELDLYDETVYNVGFGTQKKFLTSANDEVAVGDAPFYVSVLSAANSGTPNFTASQRWVVQKYDKNNVLLTTTTVNLVQGVRQPNGGSPNTYDIANLTVQLTGNEYKAVVFVQDIASPNTIRSESRTFVRGCDGVQVQWVNEFGVVDTHLFEARLVKEIDSKEETYTDFDRVERVFQNDWNYTWEVWTGAVKTTTVEWLSRMMRNRKARIVFGGTSGGTTGILFSYLYNWFTLANIVNATQTGWRVPDDTDWEALNTFLGGETVAGGKLKLTGFDYWDSPNTGATNEFGFNAVGQGRGNSGTGIFETQKTTVQWWSSDEQNASNGRRLFIFNSTADLGGFSSGDLVGFSPKTGLFSVRLVRDAIGGENDGDVIPNAYIGNDGKAYDAVVIDDQVWLSADLRETKYNGGASITFATDPADWTVATTGRVSAYNYANLVPIIPNRAYPIIIEGSSVTQSDNFDPLTFFKLKFRFAKNRRGI